MQLFWTIFSLSNRILYLCTEVHVASPTDGKGGRTKSSVTPDDTTWVLFEKYSNYSHHFREVLAAALAVAWEA